MKLPIEFTESETAALRKFAISQVASGTDRHLIDAVRVIVREHLALLQLLDLEATEAEVLGLGLPRVESQSPPAPPPPVKSKPKKLTMPAQTHGGKESYTWKVYQHIADTCLANGKPAWFTFRVSDVAAGVGLTQGQADAALRALASKGWLMKNRQSEFALTDEAKAVLSGDASKLRELGLMKE